MSHLTFILTALVFSFLLTFLIMPSGIRLLYRYRLGKNIRSEWLVGKAEEFEKLHGKKQGTPTMWGLIMIFSLITITLISIIAQFFEDVTMQWFWFGFSNSLWNQQETYIVMFTLIAVGAIGALDDYLNIRGIGRTKWLSARVKMVLLIIFALLGALWFYGKLEYNSISIPILGEVYFWLLYIPVFIFIFVAAANSVNITDGLDGLAWWLLMFQFMAYGAIAYSRGLYILSGFSFIIVGILLAFLWFNISPAKLFMGDTWSLSLGATLAVMAFLTDTMVAFVIMSGIFIFETLSVLIQITSKKLRNGKKVFRIAPFHHHLEAIGWTEENIVMRLWLIGMILAIIGVILSLSEDLSNFCTIFLYTHEVGFPLPKGVFAISSGCWKYIKTA